MPEEKFADRLTALIEARRSQIVVGLDPRLERIPEQVSRASGAGDVIEAFNRLVIDAVAEETIAVKCQVAFYEKHGLQGMRAYARTLEYARGKGLITIGDVKRNDIGSTAEAYASAHLASGSEFAADAITVNPYLGADGITPFLEKAATGGRGVFVLVKTSNPSSGDVQDLECAGVPLYEHIAGLVENWGEPYRGKRGYSLLGAVVGATYPDELARLRALMPHTLFLVPGYGAQGAGVDQVVSAFDGQGLGALVSSSRGIVYAYEQPPYSENYAPDGWQEAVREAARQMRQQIWQATH